jgi:RHS repeat-associated protein
VPHRLAVIQPSLKLWMTKENNNKRRSEGKAPGEGEKTASPPAISLPKGGGAIRGLGEKFAANPVTGAGSMTAPIATSPGRAGFGPRLALSYDSGAGNGPFGFGWSLTLPSISRKTEKGLPQYRDAEESDVFILSGSEDLVPALVHQNEHWRPDTFLRTVDGMQFRVLRYRPRLEGLFAHIERWTNETTGETHWRSISRDNVTTLYGKTAESRIADPDDPARIFSWLICQSYDDKGNAVIYEYVGENADDVDRSQVHERNRTDVMRSANRYLKRIKYGNRSPNRDAAGNIIDPALITDWMFEVVFDYGEGHCSDLPLDPARPEAEQHQFVLAQTGAQTQWPARLDQFSSYRAGFEVRTYRLCRRALMFHHFPAELGVSDYLVRSSDFTYTESPIASFITSVTQSGYVHQPTQAQPNRYLKKSLPPLEFEYSRAEIDETVHEIDAESLENLPYGLDGSIYQWVDLDGEGISGILTEQAEGWFYKRNLSPASRENGNDRISVRLAPLELIATKPNASLAAGQTQLLDLAGDGQLDLVQLGAPMCGFYERAHDASWMTFRPFIQCPNFNIQDPNLKFIDLDGDGHADVLVSEDEIFSWHTSLAEQGFGPAASVLKPDDEEKGPRLVFDDGMQSIYLADLSGDGMTDLVRIRNGEVCYWPNLGYGRFGKKVTMNHSPLFDYTDQFDQRRIRLGDIDGSGATDIFYLGRDSITFWRNQSGNSWSEPERLSVLPTTDNISSVTVVDLLGNGTACLVWSSPLPGYAGVHMRYVDLMGGQKPHLLVKVVNNLGAETRVEYSPSTKFYVADRLAGKPWITRVPFPVHVVERVETYDHISRNRFGARYAYHHGYFDGDEREFRGFGMVEQFDTEEFVALSAGSQFPAGENIDASSHVPPVLTRTWFHTGVYLGRDRISDFFAGLPGDIGSGAYYREPGLSYEEARNLLLDDTELPDGLTVEEEREACRALKGSMLRQEIYALDGSEKEAHPYTVTEQNFTIRRLQPREGARHSVFFTHEREVINYHYERNPADPRISHALTLEVDEYGNVLKSASIGYGRRQVDSSLAADDAENQRKLLVTYTENRFTNAIDADAGDDYRSPLACESRAYELTGFAPSAPSHRLQFSDLVETGSDGLRQVVDSEIRYEEAPGAGRQRRLIENIRTYYRRNDLTTCLPLGQLESLALPCGTYKLAFTPELLSSIYQRRVDNQAPESFLARAADVLGGKGADQGGYVELDGDGNWWIPSGQVFYAPGETDADPAVIAAQELAEGRQHFFLPRKFTDPFGHSAVVDYQHDLLPVRTRDALDNVIQGVNDYRVLQPRLVTDPNGNRSEVSFDVLGMVAGTALMGKATENLGDSLAGFVEDLTPQQIENFFEASDPRVPARVLLGNATTRIVYDLNRFRGAQQAYPNDPTQWQPIFAVTIARETHANDPLATDGLKTQISLSYSDGFGREIQKKIQAEPGPLVEGDVIINPRWVGSGWTIFNNKGKPVLQFEPFFSATHRFEFGLQVGVSPILFYDPTARVVVTLHPNHTYEKVVFDPWRQTTWDVNDTALLDPRSDSDIKGFTENYFAMLNSPPGDWQTWYERRRSGTLGLQEQTAAIRASAHQGTPTVMYFDTLSRPFLTVVDNGVDDAGAEQKYKTRVILDIEGNQREVVDARGRIVMRYDYDMLGNRIHQASMEAGARWMLNDVAGKPIRVWDSRGHQFRTEYDRLRRPLNRFVRGTDENHSDPRTLSQEALFERTEYGEGRQNDIALNLRTRVFRQYDGAGIVTNEAYDFKGNLLASSRQLAQDYRALPNWSALVQMESGVYRSSTSYDALNRPVSLTTPDASVIHPTYNEANLLDAVEAHLQGAAVATSFVTNIDYNARGQRTLIDYGNGVRTTYEYDALTFRMTRLRTLRGADRLQDLSYIYDPAGNITHIHDDAQQTIYFRNRRVEPSNDYTYDAIYRLIEATGREHLGQIGGAPIPHSHSDRPRIGIDWSANDGNAMGIYREQYFYDEDGNFREMIHRGSDPAHPGWTRAYTYDEDSLLETGQKSNRLSRTTLNPNSAHPEDEDYAHDFHGNMTRMPHLQVMQWDFKDQLLMTQRQAVNAQDDDGLQRQGERTYYVYDAAGQRVRKVTERASGQIKDERVYLGGFEIYRRQGVNAVVRETLHVMDDKQRIALVETRVSGNDGAPAQLIRYQFGNHLGSASLELDHRAQIISYEEYYPYGSTSYQAVQSQTDAPKRYRYSGKERDEDTGFDFFGARYYAPWLGRWTSADPENDRKTNLYAALSENPVNRRDPDGADDSSWLDLQPGGVLATFNRGGAFDQRAFARYLRRSPGHDPLFAHQVADFLERDARYKEGGATPLERAALNIGDIIGINGILEAATGQSVFAEDLSLKQRLLRGAEGTVTLVGTAFDIGGIVGAVGSSVRALRAAREAEAVIEGSRTVTRSVEASRTASSAKTTAESISSIGARGKTGTGHYASRSAPTRAGGKSGRPYTLTDPPPPTSPPEPGQIIFGGQPSETAAIPIGGGHAEQVTGTFILPEGTYLTFPVGRGEELPGPIAKYIEDTGLIPPSIKAPIRFGPGDPVPQHILHPPNWGPPVDVGDYATTVTRPTFLSDIIEPNMGYVVFTGCRVE